MQFKKLFQVLVLGGAVVGASAGCVPAANAQGKDKKPPPADAGTTSSGGGVKGW
jgi:hypothetical protein